MTETMNPAHMQGHGDSAHVLRRTFIIGLTAFLTVVDLFATQAILPSLARAYNVSPAAMGFAVNASTAPPRLSSANTSKLPAIPTLSASAADASRPNRLLATLPVM